MKKPIELIHERLKAQTQADLARQLGVTPQYLSDVIRGRREAGRKILAGLGIERVISFRRIAK